MGKGKFWNKPLRWPKTQKKKNVVYAKNNETIKKKITQYGLT